MVLAPQPHLLDAGERWHVDPPVGDPGKAVHRYLTSQDPVVAEDKELVRRQLDAQFERTGEVPESPALGTQHVTVPHPRGKAHGAPVGAGAPADALTGVAHLPCDPLAAASTTRRQRRKPPVPGALAHDASAFALGARPAEHAESPPVAWRAIVRDLAAQHLRATEGGFFERESNLSPDRGTLRAGLVCGLRTGRLVVAAGVCSLRVGAEPRQPDLFICLVDPLHTANGARGLVAVRMPLRDQPAPRRLHLCFAGAGGQAQFGVRVVSTQIPLPRTGRTAPAVGARVTGRPAVPRW